MMMRGTSRRSYRSQLLLLCALLALAAGCDSVVSTRTLRAPDVPYEPTPQHIVAEMLDMAKVTSADVVYDLGCGDGRIVIAAVKDRGARGVCVDIDPQRIKESRENALKAGVIDRITFLNQDLFETDIRDATVVTLFLWPAVNMKLRPKLWSDLRPGTRVVSFVHDMRDWAPQETRTVQSGYGARNVYLWVISRTQTAPAR